MIPQAIAHDFLLLVEDNEDDEIFAIRAISRSPFPPPVRVARDGRQAIEALEAANPRLVLLDLKLPLVSGMEVLDWARRETRLACVPIVVLTSSDEATDMLGCFRRGANAYVRKPVDYEEYLRMMRATLEFWIGHNRRP